MPLSTIALGAALTPTILSTGIQHYLHRRELHRTPRVHFAYHEGINIIRGFLAYAAKHTLEDLQHFSEKPVPHPHWVRVEDVTIPDDYLASAAAAIIKELGPNGVAKVGGENWWQWRGSAEDLKCEWIEMRADYNHRKKCGKKCNRIMLYVHGGAFFFGSLETHRYQMQRHARKLKGRVFAVSYRLAPQFPFPCSLQDCLAAYLYLLTMHEPNEIILAGDSAGGNMVLSMLVTLRDQGLPLPAGGILISPWVDLTHSFPSISEDNPNDYIPPYGFRHKPSEAWPPPNTDEMLELKKAAARGRPVDGVTNITREGSQEAEVAARGFTVLDGRTSQEGPAYPGLQDDAEPATTDADTDFINIASDSVVVTIDGQAIKLKDQIQMYATNRLLSHPLVSPVLQPSLGGLPPLLIQSGGGEMLRDEQFYIAHKAANPQEYPPSDVILDEYDPDREILHKYRPTYVQLQVWDNLCHVAPTLSFSRPAKYMYRAIAQFGAWALARAQGIPIDIREEQNQTTILPALSSGPSTAGGATDQTRPTGFALIGKAGDPLPAFKRHMIRQRVDKKGRIFPLKKESAYPLLRMDRSEIGAINTDLVKRWLIAKQEWDIKFAKQKLEVQSQRMKELVHLFNDFDGESPPPSALAARTPDIAANAGKKTPKMSYGMMIWSKWASKHDHRALERERQADLDSKRTSLDHGSSAEQSDASSYSRDSSPATTPDSREARPDNDSPDNGENTQTSRRFHHAMPASAEPTSSGKPGLAAGQTTLAGEGNIPLSSGAAGFPDSYLHASALTSARPNLHMNDNAVYSDDSEGNASTVAVMNADGVLRPRPAHPLDGVATDGSAGGSSSSLPNESQAPMH